MGKALYRTYRSKRLEDIVGQSHVTDVLSRALKQGRIAHAYLLTGPRGVGKTSIARILAHEINNLPYDDSEHLDIIEIDAASNNGVEDVRDLRDKVQIAPTSASKKVYIIDEVHMLSKPAFNALLKTLEEPPEHIVFILATTDVEKLPGTIISRTQRYNLRRINVEDAKQHLATIAKKEHIAIDDEALTLLAEHGDGSFRDAINLLDQLASIVANKETITGAMIESHLGVAPKQLITDILDAYASDDLTRIIALLQTSASEGIPPKLLGRQLIVAATELVPSQPYLLPLIEALVQVEQSARPDITLLTALAHHIQTVRPTPKTPPATSAIPTPTPPTPPETPKPAPVTPKKKPEPKTVENSPADATPERTSEPDTQNDHLPTEPSQNFPWNELLSTAKARFVALYSVLNKSGYHFDGTILTIYAGSKFFKTKLDAQKHRASLMALSKELGVIIEDIICLADKAPIADPKLATVAELMGGGEQVDIS